MPAVLADLCIEARWIVPMTVPNKVLDNHSLMVRDGRILDILPSAAVAERYTATAFIERPTHLLIPGLVNSATCAAASLFRGQRSAADAYQRLIGPEFVRDGVLAAIADMLCSGVTCFADRYCFPDQAARAASEQGMRAVIGLPMAEGLNLRDEYQGHPLVSTAFAPPAPNTVSDSAFAHIATLADELDAAIMVDLHESADAIADCVAQHGMRPIERLWKLGLLTPALTAIHMVHATPEDIELARRTGISVSLCPQSNLQQGFGMAPVHSFAASGIRVGLGSGNSAPLQWQDVWGEIRLLALTACSGATAMSAWDALAIATRGGAAVLGLDADIGTLETGKWADLCCLDLGGPSTQPVCDPVQQLVFGGSRDIVSDTWVAGRQLLSNRELTRLDWPAVAARANAWAERLNCGG